MRHERLRTRDSFVASDKAKGMWPGVMCARLLHSATAGLRQVGASSPNTGLSSRHPRLVETCSVRSPRLRERRRQCAYVAVLLLLLLLEDGQCLVVHTGHLCRCAVERDEPGVQWCSRVRRSEVCSF